MLYGATAAVASLLVVGVAAVPGRGPEGRLITVERTWRDPLTFGGRRLCLTVENQDRRVAHEVVAWVEWFSGEGNAMRRVSLTRGALHPPTLAPGESGGVCIDAPGPVRGVFVRLRARWQPERPPRSATEPAPRP